MQRLIFMAWVSAVLRFMFKTIYREKVPTVSNF